MNAYKQELTTLGIAAGGLYGTAPGMDLGNGCKSTCSVTIYDTRLSAYLGDVVEDGIIIDKRPCVNHPDFVRWIVSGPMLDVNLPHDTKQDLGQPVPCTLEGARVAGGFEHISLNLEVALWMERGARIGIRKGDSVFWNDGPLFGFGSEEKIPPAEDRYK